MHLDVGLRSPGRDRDRTDTVCQRRMRTEPCNVHYTDRQQKSSEENMLETLYPMRIERPSGIYITEFQKPIRCLNVRSSCAVLLLPTLRPPPPPIPRPFRRECSCSRSTSLFFSCSLGLVSRGRSSRSRALSLGLSLSRCRSRDLSRARLTSSSSPIRASLTGDPRPSPALGERSRRPPRFRPPAEGAVGIVCGTLAGD